MAIPTLATVGGQLFATGYPGQLAATADNPIIESRVNENATAINFGDAVVQGVATTPGNIGNVKPPVSGGVVIGLAVRALSEANTAVPAGTVNYPQFQAVPVLNDGYMWVTASENVTEGDAGVCVVASAGIGGATGGAANGTTRLAIPGSIWKQTVVSGSVGLIHIKTA
jgi:hypothetical protein